MTTTEVPAGPPVEAQINPSTGEAAQPTPPAPPPEPPKPKGPYLLTEAQIQKHRDKLDRKMGHIAMMVNGTLKYCYNYGDIHGNWMWMDDANQCVRLSARDSLLYTAEHRRRGLGAPKFMPIDQELALQIISARKTIEDFLPAQIVAVLKLAPMNAQARTHLHAAMHVPVPAECDTYDKICEWVVKTDSTRTKELVAKRDLSRVGPLYLAVNLSDIETGTCKYFKPRNRRIDLVVPAAVMRKFIEDNPEADSAEMEQLVSEWVKDNAWVGMALNDDDTDYDEVTHDNHQPSPDGPTDRDTNIYRRNIMSVREDIVAVCGGAVQH